MRADLHCHTKYSDGLLSVREVLARAKEKGLDYLAITDHDCFDGSTEAFKIASEYGITPIYGIELSTKRNGESIHVLGYYKKELICGGKFFDMMDNQRLNRKKRAREIIVSLKEHFGFEMDPSFIETHHSITRGTIGDELLKQGFVSTKKEAFTKMIGDDCPCYIASTKLSTEEGIKLIKESGGLCVLAHPCLYKHNEAEDLFKLGFDGVEAVYPRIENREQKYRDLARKYNMFITAGSDFHLINDYNHGDIGDCYIKDQDLRTFLKRLDELE